MISEQWAGSFTAPIRFRLSSTGDEVVLRSFQCSLFVIVALYNVYLNVLW